MTPCKEYWETLNAFVDGECSPEEEARLRAHLETCEACRTALADLTAIQDACEEWAGEPDDFTDSEFLDIGEEDVPEGFTEAVLARVAQTPQTAASGKHGKRRFAAWASLAACLALVLLLGRVVPGAANNSAAPSSDAVFSGYAAADSAVAGSAGEEAAQGAASGPEASVPYSTDQTDRGKMMTDTGLADLCWTLTAEEETALLSSYDCQESAAGRVYTLTASQLAELCAQAGEDGVQLDLPQADVVLTTSAGSQEPEKASAQDGETTYRVLVQSVEP